MTIKKERIESRLTEMDKNLLKRAASYTGEDLSAFVLRNALKSAQEVISKYQEDLGLSKADQKLFYELILNPPSPNSYLKQNAKAYMKKEIVNLSKNQEGNA